MRRHIRVDARALRLQAAAIAVNLCLAVRNHFAMACVLVCGISLSADATDFSQTETARDYLVQVWQTDKGLPQNWVSSIAQTPDGYLWVGTRYGGLARFDGVRFVPFNQQNVAELKDV